MILDFDTLQLRYCINGKDYGAADIIDEYATYRAVVMLRGECSVELLWKLSRFFFSNFLEVQNDKIHTVQN